MSFSLYPIVYSGQKFIQKGLYRLSSKYRVEVHRFFEAIIDEDYIVIKLDTPNIHKRFPLDYKIGTDIDIIILDENLDRIKNKIIALNKDKKLNCLVLEDDQSVKIRYQFYGFLNLLFDLTGSSANELYSVCIKHTNLEKNIKTPEIKYEIVIRAIEFQNKPQKKYHLNYIVKNKNYIDFDLLSNYGIQPNIIEKIKTS